MYANFVKCLHIEDFFTHSVFYVFTSVYTRVYSMKVCKKFYFTASFSFCKMFIQAKIRKEHDLQKFAGTICCIKNETMSESEVYSN